MADVTHDGVEIVVGLRVVDYDMKRGVVSKVDDSERIFPDVPWHTVKRDDGTTKKFDGSRLYSEDQYDENQRTCRI